MIGLEKACENVIALRGYPYVSEIVDVGGAYIIGVTNETGVVSDSAPVYVNKKTGYVGALCVPAHFEKLEKGKKIKIPEKYKLFKK